MKELSIEEKEEKVKRYDEALALMQDCIPDENGLVHVRPEEIFPELKESEGERIRKALITYFSDEDESYDGIPYPNILAWLKKQGEKKPVWSEEDETMTTNIIIMLKEGASLHFNKNDIAKGVDWLKSLKHQNTWKPSDKQMEVLVWCKPLFYDPKSKGILESLINDLKKLMDE